MEVRIEDDGEAQPVGLPGAATTQEIRLPSIIQRALFMRKILNVA